MSNAPIQSLYVKNSFQMYLLIAFGGGVYRRQLVLDKAMDVE